VGKSAGSFGCQVTSLVPAMFCNFYLVKNHKIADHSATTKAIEKRSTYFESLEFFDACLKNIKFYLIKLATDI